MTFDATSEDHLVYLISSGSRLYGTNTASSDYDKLGVCIPPKSHLYGLKTFETKEFKHEGNDLTIHSLKKFIGLAANCNPTLIELLSAPASNILVLNDVFLPILKNKEKFYSKMAYNAFVGYAKAQLHRLKNRRKWLTNPPFETDPEYPTYKELLELRNAKRRALELKYGYDTKHALHCVRLLYECEHLLQNGELLVANAPWTLDLIAIRDGVCSFDSVQQLINSKISACEALLPASKLPEKPDMNFIDNLCVSVTEEFLDAV